MKRKLKMDKSKLKEQLKRHQQADEGASVEAAGQLPEKRLFVQSFEFVEVVGVPKHRQEARYRPIVSRDAAILSEYISVEAFGTPVPPKTIQITVEW